MMSREAKKGVGRSWLPNWAFSRPPYSNPGASHGPSAREADPAALFNK